MNAKRKMLSFLLSFVLFFSMVGINGTVASAIELQGEITLETWLEPAKTTYEVGETVTLWVRVTNNVEYTFMYFQFDDAKFDYSRLYTAPYDDLITPGWGSGFSLDYTFTPEDVGEFVNVFRVESEGIVAESVTVFTVVDPNAEPDKPVKSGRPSWSGGPGKPPGKPGTPGKPVKSGRPSWSGGPGKPPKRP